MTLALNGTHATRLLAIPCPSCLWQGATLNDLATHRLDMHELPLPEGRTWTWVAIRGPYRFVPPNWRAASLREWYERLDGGATP
jgi:hypothetical protein